MTSESIRQQIQETIQAIRETTARARKSKASAIKYLVDLGLIEDEKPLKRISKTKK